ncbi:NUDIX hydrolase domain-like protein [Geopyxis carbonaria]|nr:NUDIX hydrolase domain-like protein [Geopyxis carbonaria]
MTSLAACKTLSRTPLMIRDAKWVTLKHTTYLDAAGRTRTWESAERTTRPSGCALDGVGIIAILNSPSTPPSLLLQKQFRPPVDAICIEVPAGLIDAGETPSECAVRELREETGYVGVVREGEKGVSCLMYNDPGMCNTNTVLVHVDIDLEKPENKEPKPQLEDGEFIECFTVPLARLWEECKVWEKKGWAVDARVATMAEGIEVARKWGVGA